MASTVVASTQINLSSEVIKNIVLEVVEVTQALGLSLNAERVSNWELYADVLALIQRYNSLESLPFPFPGQTWN